jgi:hypothetical protein
MGLKRKVVSVVGAIMMTSMLSTSLNVFAEVGEDDTLQTIEVTNDTECLETIQSDVTEDSTTTLSDSDVVTPIYYDVPAFRQNDTTSAWYNLRINNSSSVMSKSGCLITSFAMLRSYQTGTYIYPTDMMKSYSNETGVGVVFASNNSPSMIIPSSARNYGWSVYGKNVVNNSFEIPDNQKNTQELFKVLYDKLKNGPVIFGGYKNKGGRASSNHWIVVTGYTGDGKTFSASDFTINDSGSFNNFTLAEYQTTYAYWDRLIYIDAQEDEAIDEETETVETLKGDINLDGKIDTYDLLIFRKYVLDMIELNEDVLSLNDLNDDGEVDVKDYLQLKIQLYSC